MAADDAARQMYYGDRDFGYQERLERYLANPPGAYRAPSTSSIAGAYAGYEGDPRQDQPGIGHELPIPRAFVPDAVPNQPMPMPPSAGWAGGGGQTANVIANFLHGWMQGRQTAQARRDQQAQQQVNAAWADYARTAAIASNPDLGDQAQAAIKLLPKKAQAYSDVVKQYEPPDQPHRGFLQRVAQAFTTRQPVMFPAGAHESPLPTAPIPQSPQQRAQRAVAGLYEGTVGQEKTILDVKNERDKLFQQKQQAQARNDGPAVADIDAQIRNLEVRAQGLQQKDIIPGALEAQQSRVGALTTESDSTRQYFQTRTAANKALGEGKSVWELPGDQQMALGIQPGQHAEVQAYLKYVGKPGGFATETEAIRAMEMDKAKAMATAYGVRTPMAQIEQRVRLEHPDWNEQQVMEETLHIYRPAADKSPISDPKKFAEARALIGYEVYAQHPEMQGLFTNIGSKQKPELVFNQGAQATQHWFWPNESQDEFQGRMNGAREALWTVGRNAYGFDDGTLTQMFGPKPPSFGGAAQRPAAGAAPATPSAAAPASAAPAPPQGQPATPTANNPMQQYRVTDATGKTKVVAMTPEQVRQAQAGQLQGPKGAINTQGWKFEPASPQASPAPQGGAKPGTAVPTTPPGRAAAAPAPVVPPASAKPVASHAPAATPAATTEATPETKLASIRALDPGTEQTVRKQIQGIFQQFQGQGREVPETMIAEFNRMLDAALVTARENANEPGRRGLEQKESERQRGIARSRNAATTIEQQPSSNRMDEWKRIAQQATAARMAQR